MTTLTEADVEQIALPGSPPLKDRVRPRAAHPDRWRGLLP